MKPLKATVRTELCNLNRLIFFTIIFVMWLNYQFPEMRFQTNDIFSCPLDPQTLGSVDFTYAILYA